MSISGIGGSSAASYFATLYKNNSTSPSAATPASATPTSLSADAASANSPEATFLKFAKESPAQRMIDEWLKAHNLTQDELNKMPAAQRDAILKQMTQDIKNEVQKKTDDAAANIKTDILV